MLFAGRSFCGFAVCLAALPAFAAPVSNPDFFEIKVRPVLAKNCFGCHTKSALGGLRLDSRDGLVRGGKSGPAITPGQPESSLLIQAVTRTHPTLKMPPSGKLPDEEIADLTHWIKDGAVWPDAPPAAPAVKVAFWAFQPIRPSQATIDVLIDRELAKNGLKPVKPASRRVLLRRATFDLTGLPPTPEEVDAFESDQSSDAFAKVVDRLLASPRYGERWGRLWLDLARYADGQLGAAKDTPYANAFRYRDWVIAAFNHDMPYDRFVKAQIAADLMPESQRPGLLAGLGFQALGNDDNDRVDVTTRTFLGFTVGCAQCHDHKYDPIPTKDYYALLGIFKSSVSDESPLAPADVVDAYKHQKKAIDELQGTIDDFIKKQGTELSEILAHKTSRYMMAAWKVSKGAAISAAAGADSLDEEILSRWVRYLKQPDQEHPYLKPWYEALSKPNVTEPELRKVADAFQAFVVSVFTERAGMEDRNYVKLGGAKGAKDEATRQYTNLESLAIEKYYLWRDLASDPFQRNGSYFPGGVYYFGKPSTIDKDFDTRGVERPPVQDIVRFLSGEWREHLERMRADLESLKKALPPQYPFLHALKDSDKPAFAYSVASARRLELRHLALLLGAWGHPWRFAETTG